MRASRPAHCSFAQGLTRLRRSDLVAALTLIAELGEIATLDDFPFRVTSLLRALLGADAASYTEGDPALGAPVWTFDPPGVILGGLAAAMAAAADHPVITHFARTGDLRSLRISDFLSLRQFQRLEIYDTVFRPIGAKYQLATALFVPGPMPTGLGFMRARRDFTEREQGLLDFLRPHIANARENLRARTTAQERIAALERGLEEQGRGVVVVRDGRVTTASDHGARLLGRWFGTDPPPLPVPHEALVLERDGVRLSVRRVDGDPGLILMDEIRFEPDPARTRELGLTAREAEILTLVGRGLTDLRIAERLVVSVRTVEKHLERAYGKLEVTDRRQAVARVLGRVDGVRIRGRQRDASGSMPDRM